jgi:predicted ATPase
VPGGQSRFCEGLRQTLSAICQGSAPNLLFFDDMQWADAASLNLLAYLVRRLAGQPLFILAAWRSDEGQPAARLAGLVADAQRAGRGTALTLKRLALGEDAAWPVPRGVTDLLRPRLAAVRDAALQALQAAAVIGRSFDLDVLQAISRRSDEETVSALEALADREIIREISGEIGTAPRYGFTHEKLRGLVYDETNLARRRLLHGRAARALSERARLRHELAAQAAIIARHYRLAGQEADAAASYALAGDHARSLYANAEALAHYQAALALGHPEPCRLHQATGDMPSGHTPPRYCGFTSTQTIPSCTSLRAMPNTGASSTTGTPLTSVRRRLRAAPSSPTATFSPTATTPAALTWTGPL